MSLKVFAISAALFTIAAGSAYAGTVDFEATLKGSDEVPPTTSTATGTLHASLDTKAKVLTYDVHFTGLTGPAIAAHFHGPAAPGVNAPPVIPMTVLTSPIEADHVLTDAQMADVMAGKWYFNIHTAANPGGEIRGQLIRKKQSWL